MKGVKIERCTDLQQLILWRMEVLRCVFSIPEDADTQELEQRNRLYYARHLADGSHIACIALMEGEAVGCGGICLYEEMPSPDNPTGRCAYLMDIYVREPFRRKGAGRRIVDWLVERAHEQGITKIYLETTSSGRALYESSGFEDMKGMMIWKR